MEKQVSEYFLFWHSVYLLMKHAMFAPSAVFSIYKESLYLEPLFLLHYIPLFYSEKSSTHHMTSAPPNKQLDTSFTPWPSV